MLDRGTLHASVAFVLACACAPPVAPTSDPASVDPASVAVAKREEAASAEAPQAASAPEPRPWADHFAHEELVTELSRSDDGTLLVSRGATMVKVWDASTGELRRTLTRPSVGANALRQTAVSSTVGVAVATGIEGYRAFTTLGLTDPQHVNGTSVGPEPCGALAFSGQGMLAVACEDDIVYLLRLPSLVPTSTIPAIDDIAGVAFSPDGNLLAVAGIGGLAIFTTLDGSTFQPELSAGQKIALGVRFTPDGQHVVVGWHTGLDVYDVATKKWVAEIRLNELPKDRGRHIDVSPDGTLVIIAGEVLRMEEILTAATRHVVPSVNAHPFQSDVIFAGDGVSLYVPTDDGGISRVAIEP